MDTYISLSSDLSELPVQSSYSESDELADCQVCLRCIGVECGRTALAFYALQVFLLLEQEQAYFGQAVG